VILADLGCERVRGMREALVGVEESRRQEAGWPLGVLLLRGLLADPGEPEPADCEAARERYRAGERFAVDRAIVLGIASPGSHIAGFIEGKHRGRNPEGIESDAQRNAALRYGKKVAAVRLLQPISGVMPAHVLQRVVIDEEYPVSDIDVDALIIALDAIAGVRAS